jgi:spermidine/putrescine transport system substrate-binding protein
VAPAPICRKLKGTAAALAAALGVLCLIVSLKTGAAAQELEASELHIYNWSDYTNPALVEKFERQYGVKITIHTHESEDSVLEAARARSGRYDIAVPLDHTVRTMIEEGLLERTEPDRMENFKNLDPKLVNIYFDPGRHYSVPWQYGFTSLAVDTAKFAGPIDTLELLYAPPPSLKGQVNLLDDEEAVILGAARYLELPRCTRKPDDLAKIEQLLLKAKSSWASISNDTVAKMASGSIAVTQTWNGAAYRMRAKNPSVKLAITKAAMEGWMDNVVVLKGARNLENARRFQNFIMAPENAALISEDALYYSAVIGVDKYLPRELAAAPEINPPQALQIEFAPPCPADVTALHDRIWAKLKQ